LSFIPGDCAVAFRERLKKRTAAALVGRYGRLFSALGENAQLHQWLAKGGDYRIFDDRFTMYEHLVTQIGKSTPIDFLEFGVFRGDSLFKWAQLNTATDSRFIGFDSFEGLPEVWTAWYGPGKNVREPIRPAGLFPRPTTDGSSSSRVCSAIRCALSSPTSNRDRSW
jgi:hypothetical protein